MQAQAITTSESRAVIPCAVTIPGSTPRRSSSRKIRRDTFSTICTCTHEWSDIPSRSAFVCCTSHHALSWSSAFAASSSAWSLRLPAGRRAQAHRGDRLARRRIGAVSAMAGTLQGVRDRSGPGAGCRPSADRRRAGACSARASRGSASASTSSSREEPKWHAIWSSGTSAASCSTPGEAGRARLGALLARVRDLHGLRSESPRAAAGRRAARPPRRHRCAAPTGAAAPAGSTATAPASASTAAMRRTRAGTPPRPPRRAMSSARRPRRSYSARSLPE